MVTKDGIPFRNMINSKLLVVEQKLLKLLYREQHVTVIATGWGNYHVIVEDGVTNETEYAMMSADDVNNNFNVDITKY